MLTVKNHHFYIDGKETILYGGEVNYFRIPRAQWEDRLRKLKNAGMNLVSTLVPWMYHEPVQGQPDFAGARHPETDLGAYLALIQKLGLYCILKPGPYVMSEMRNHGLPDWLFDEYPHLLARTPDGGAMDDHTVYLEDGEYLALVERWYAAVGEAAKPYMEENGGPILMVQLDNEIGMLNWCSGMPDSSPGNIRAFHRWLRERGWDPEPEEEKFRALVASPPEEITLRLNEELTRYSRLYYRRYFEHLQAFARKHLGDTWFVVNVHGFETYDIIKRGKEYPSGVSQLYGVSRAEKTLTSGDYYLGNVYYDNFQDLHLANAYTYAAQNPDQPLFSDEFQCGFQQDLPRVGPASYDLSARLCIGDGMDGISFFLFAGGENPDDIGYYGYRHSWQAPLTPEGRENVQYPYLVHLGQVLTACGPTLAKTDFRPVVELGIILDYYMSEYQYRNPILEEKRLHIEQIHTQYLFNGLGKGLPAVNLSYRGKNLEEPVSPEESPCLVVCATGYMAEEIQIRLKDYVEAGGKLFLFPMVPTRDMAGNPCTVLRDFLGCGTEVYEDGMVTVDGYREVPMPMYSDFGEMPGAFAREERTGRVCGYWKEYGKGTVLCYGMGHTQDYYFRDQILLDQFRKLGIVPRFTTDSVEDKLFLSCREALDGSGYLTVLNVDEYPKSTHVFDRGAPLFGGKALTVPARKGLLLPRNISLARDLTVVWSTGEVLGVDPDGIWLTLALAQPREEILVRTNRTIVGSGAYQVTVTGEGYHITSNLDGRICDKLTIYFEEE